MKDLEASLGERIYEYVDQDGVVFYSFTRLPQRVSLVRRLEVQSILGTHITNFITKVRRLSDQLNRSDVE